MCSSCKDNPGELAKRMLICFYHATDPILADWMRQTKASISLLAKAQDKEKLIGKDKVKVLSEQVNSMEESAATAFLGMDPVLSTPVDVSRS